MTEQNTITAQQKKFEENLRERGLASSTILAYLADIRQLTDFFAKRQIQQVAAVTSDQLREYKEFLESKDYQAKSVARKLNAIKSFFKFLTQSGVIKEDPAEPITHPKYKIKPPRILSKMEYRALRDAARKDAKISAVIEMFLQTGLRVGELTRLKLTDVDNQEVRVIQYESHDARCIPLNRAAKKALDRCLKVRPETDSDSLFVTRYGRPLLVRNLRVSLNRYFKKAGIKSATINSLRHTFITYQLAQSVPVILVQRLVGHKRLTTTEKYLELVRDQIEQKVHIEEL